MTSTLTVRTSMRMAAPVHLVSAQYRDIDHHIQHNVHPAIRYQWEPSAPGEQKIRTKFRILGIPQYDVSLLETSPDGTFIIRYLEGSNAGALLYHRFKPLPDGSTLVELEVHVPAGFVRRLFAPFFKLGARLVMLRALREDKLDVERGHYHATSTLFTAGTAGDSGTDDASGTANSVIQARSREPEHYAAAPHYPS